VNPADAARRDRHGLVFAIACASVSAFQPGMARLTTGSVDALAVSLGTTAAAGLAALVHVALRGELRVLFTRSRVPRVLALATLGTAVPIFLFFEGARLSSATLAALCIQIEPAYSLALAWLVLGHRPNVARLLSVGAILGGIALATGVHGVASSQGIALLLAAPLCWQLSHLVALRGLGDASAAALTAARYVFGAMIIGTVWLARGGASALPRAPELAQILPVLALQGVALYWFGTFLWYQTILRLDLARATAIVTPSVPLLSLGASFALVGEIPTAAQASGMVLAASGVLALALAGAPRHGAKRSGGRVDEWVG
jgi:drug/metabolite transporter (DMT)-like permease